MTALIWICGIVLLFCLILALPFRLACKFKDKNQIDFYIGWIRIRKKPSAHKEKKSKEKEPKAKRKKKKPKPSITDVISLLDISLAALKDSGKYFCRHLLIEPLTLCIVFAGDDPATVAKTFGFANAAMWSIMPKAEELFIIPDPAIHLDMDFEAEKTKVTGEVSLMIRIGSLLMCLLILSIPLLRWYRRFKKKHAVAEKQQKNDKKERTQNDGKESTDQ